MLRSDRHATCRSPPAPSRAHRMALPSRLAMWPIIKYAYVNVIRPREPPCPFLCVLNADEYRDDCTTCAFRRPLRTSTYSQLGTIQYRKCPFLLFFFLLFDFLKKTEVFLSVSLFTTFFGARAGKCTVDPSIERNTTGRRKKVHGSSSIRSGNRAPHLV